MLQQAQANPTPILHEEGCTFQTIFGETSSEGRAVYNIPENVQISLDKGLKWVVEAQQKNGGWGAGSHSRQNIRDPHAVQTDPATTAMVAMALLRSNNTLLEGEYSDQLKGGLFYILEEVESASANSPNITKLNNTQIQAKLGQNIDVVLATQFLSNIIDYTAHDLELKDRVMASLNICTEKIQKHQKDGKAAGAGWAGVLAIFFCKQCPGSG